METQENEAIPSSQDDPLIGMVVGEKYRIESPLGKGGMGVLYKARHKVLDKQFVIKLIRTSVGGENVRVERKRFLREARSIGRVNHPNVVNVVDYEFLTDNTPYIVMEFVEGVDLDDFVERQFDGELPLDLFFAFARQLCDAVAAIHEAGVVHRDLKPQNVMVCRAGDEYHLKVIDFGLALVDRPDAEVDEIKLTSTGMIMGTPAYMAPEQALAKEITRATDIYSLGLIFYELMAGEAPFRGKSAIEVLTKQLREIPQPIYELRHDVTTEMYEPVARALAKDPEDRYDSALDLKRALIEASVGQPPAGRVPTDAKPGRLPWVAILFVLLLSAAAGISWYLFRDPLRATTTETDHGPLVEADALWNQGQHDQAMEIYLDFFEKHPLDPLVQESIGPKAAFKQKFQLGFDKSLEILNWENYLGQMTTFTFAREHQVGVDVVGYTQTEQVYGLMESEQPDVIIVIEGIISELILQEKLLPLDHAKLPNLKNLDPTFASLKYDQGNVFSVPYVWGTLGLFYDPEKYDGKPWSWAFLFEPENLEGRVVIVPDYVRELYGIALKYRGFDYNATDPDKIAQAEQTVEKAFPYWERVGTEEPLRRRLKQGGVDIAFTWSGFASQMRDDCPNMVFVMPEEGSNLGVDNLAIPVTAKNVDAAHAFINHVLKPCIGAELAQALNYATPNLAARVFFADQKGGFYQDLSGLLNCDFDLNPSEVLNRVQPSWDVLKQAGSAAEEESQ